MHADPEQIAHLTAVQELESRDLLWFVYDRSATGIFVLDAATMRIVAANPSACRAVNLSLRQLVNKHPSKIAPHLSAKRLRHLLGNIRRRPNSQITHVMRGKSGRDSSYRVTASYLESNKSSIVVSVDDVSRTIGAEFAAVQAKQLLLSAIEALPDGFVLYDKDDRLVLCNQTYRQIYGASASAIVPGATFESILRNGLKHGQYATAAGREEAWLEERLSKHATLGDDVEQELADGRWLRIVERMTSDGGRVGLRVDITRLKEQQAALFAQARTDQLTGLRNRRDLQKDIASWTETLDQGERIALIQLDLDRFKRVNDVFGHSAGDHVLRICAERLQSIEPVPLCVSRMGGDEFLVVVRTTDNHDGVSDFCKDIVSQLSRPISYREHQCRIGAFVGVSFLKAGEQHLGAEALSSADIALNLARKEGSDAIAVFKPFMRDELIRDADMTEEMRRGMLADEFVPHFQPQLNAFTGEVTGFEALIRWTPKGRPPVAAGEFLRVAQESGLTDALDDIVMEQSCAAVRQLINWGMPEPRVSINLSMAQISDPALLKRLEKQMRHFGIAHRHLRIELLESTLLDDRTINVIKNVHAMIAAGFQMELDDFGTGHAAIATLRRFDVSRIKIDRSFVKDIDHDDSLQTMTSAMIDLAHNLGISVLAEGVERQEEQDILHRFGCYAAQGYLHARPMPISDIHSFLRARGALTETPTLRQ